MFKKTLVIGMIVANFSLISSAFADTTVVWQAPDPNPLTYDQEKFVTWYGEPGHAKVWSDWYTQYHTDPAFVTFCKQDWAGNQYCK